MELFQQLTVVSLVLALAVLAAHTAQRRGWLRLNWPMRTAVSRPLELVDRLALTPQHQLHLIRIEGRTLLLATHARGVDVIESHPQERSTAARAGSGRPV